MVRSKRNCPARPSLGCWRVTGLEGYSFTSLRYRGRGVPGGEEGKCPLPKPGPSEAAWREKKGGRQPGSTLFHAV